MKKDYELKLKLLEEKAANNVPASDFASGTNRGTTAKPPVLNRSHSVLDEEGNVVRVDADGTADSNGGDTSKVNRKSISQMQQDAMLK